MPAKRKPATRRKAATADVLGQITPRHGQIPEKWKRQRDQLLRLRDHFLNRQGNLARDAAEEQSAFSLHMADAGTDSFDRDLALSQISSEQDAVYEIDDALIRIADGTYGICELTGKPIERARLEAIPWTRFSVEAEAQLEKEGSLRRARLGSRQPLAQAENHAADQADGATSRDSD